MLCEFCALIDLDRLYGSSTDYENVPSAYGTAMIPGYALIPEDRHQYPHHTSYKDLIISAENGCDLCTMIWMRDIQRRHHAPWDCSVLGWEKLQVLDALSESDDGFSLVSILKLGSLNGCVYKIDSQSDPRIYCSVGFTENWCEGWEVAVGPDIGPQDLRFYQEGSTNDIVGVGLHSRLAISIEHGDTSVVGRLIRSRPINQYSMSPQCISMILKWIEWCPYHSKCNKPLMHPLPSRVIDVGPSDGSQEPFLSITNGKEGSWMALSHCWGKTLPLRTTTATEKLHRWKITHLPPTFQDAVIITRALGIRFLWIDALCIIQDSQQDWAAESSKMGRIYEDAFLTLQLDAEDSSVSLLGPRKPADVWLKVPFTMHSQACKGSLYLGSEATNVASSFVNSRAWTFQEFLLSPRTLALNASGFIWSCRSDFALERMPEPYDNWVYKAPQWSAKMDFWGPGLDERESGDPSFHYYLLVCEYMGRDVSFETDRLVAWSAIAREVGRRTNWEYLAGLWKQDMHRGLLWSYEGYGQGFSNYVAPTWSWASQTFLDIGKGNIAPDRLPKVYGGVFRYILSERDAKFDCTICKIEVDAVTDDLYGQLRFGQISVHGKWKRADVLCVHRMPYYVIGHTPRYLYTDDYRDTYLSTRYNEDYVQDKSVKIICDFDTSLGEEVGNYEGPQLVQATDVQKRQARDWSQLSFLQISKWKCSSNPLGTIWALILQAEDNSNTVFKRVGVAQLADDISTDWESRAVKIV